MRKNIIYLKLKIMIIFWCKTRLKMFIGETETKIFLLNLIWVYTFRKRPNLSQRNITQVYIFKEIVIIVLFNSFCLHSTFQKPIVYKKNEKCIDHSEFFSNTNLLVQWKKGRCVLHNWLNRRVRNCYWNATSTSRQS